MALKELDVVLLKAKTGVNDFAENEYAAETSVTARWNDEQKLVSDDNGIEFTSRSTIYFIDPDKFKVGDAVKLTGSDDDFRMIRAIEKFKNNAQTKFFNIAYLDYATK